MAESILSLISNSISLYPKLIGTVTRVSITFDTILTLMFPHFLFSFLARFIIIIIIIYSLKDFHWSDSKSPQVPNTLLILLNDLNYVVVWMVSTHCLISKFPGVCTNLLVTVPKAPIITGIQVTLMFHSFINSKQGRCIYPSFHFL